MTHRTPDTHETSRHILLIEDNAGDARLVEEALRDFTTAVKLHHVSDQEEALAFVASGDPHPDLILLDLNMPLGDGRELLAALKGDPVSRSIPVLALTTSDAPRDVAKCYELGVNAYLRKPVDMDRFLDMMRLIEAFWFKTAVLPGE